MEDVEDVWDVEELEHDEDLDAQRNSEHNVGNSQFVDEHDEHGDKQGADGVSCIAFVMSLFYEESGDVKFV